MFFASLKNLNKHSTTVASGRYVFREGCYVLRSATPEGTPAFAPDSTALAPDSTTLRSFRSVSFVPKSRSVSKKVFENEHFVCSLVGKKKNQRTLLILFWIHLTQTTKNVKLFSRSELSVCAHFQKCYSF